MKLERIFSGAGLILLPFIVSVGNVQDQMRWPKAQFLILLSGFYLAALIFRRINGPLGASLALLLVSGHFSRSGYPIDTIACLMAAGVSCFWVIRPKENEIQVAFKCLEFAALLCGAYATLQWLHMDPILTFYENADKTRPPVFFGQHTLYGPFAAAAFSTALFSGRKLVALLLFLPILMVNASFTFLAAGVAIAIYAVYRLHYKALLLLPICGILYSGLYLTKRQVAEELVENNGRFVLWNITYRISKVHPWMGHGLGSFEIVFPIFQSEEKRRELGLDDSGLSEESKTLLKEAELLRIRSGFFRSAHNEYLQLFFELGIPGLIAALGVIVSFFLHWRNLPGTKENWALLAIFCLFLANAAGNFPLHLIPQAILPLWAFVAVTTKNRGGILDL